MANNKKKADQKLNVLQEMYEANDMAKLNN